MATNYNLGELNVGSVDRLRVTITKDGSAWDLSSGSVTMTFESPDRSTQFTRTMTAESASGGIFYYDTDSTEFTTVGRWTLTVTVTDGDVVKKYPGEVSFRLTDQP